jgi:PAS domain S-box-containing protein
VKIKLRNSGIDIIGDVPWGTYFCQFYQTKEDLADILVPYFKAGLENNEFCLWVTSQPLEVEDAIEALRWAIPDLNTYLEKGQIEIISYTCLNVTGSIYDSERVVNGCIEKLNHALESGYEGMRLSGNTSWLEKKDWAYLVDYMGKMDDIIGKYQMIALGSYFIDKYSAAEITEVVSNHQFSLIKREGKWERIDNSGRKKAEEAVIQATNNWEYTFDAVPDPIAILDNKYRVVRVNRAMAERLGVTPEECVGVICYRAIHGTDKPPSFCPHRQLLKDKLEHIKEVREDNLGGDFIVSVSPLFNSEGKITGCIHVARDINERKQSEEALKKAYDSLEEKVKILLNAVESSDDAIVTGSPDGTITSWNKGAEQVYGYSAEEILGKNLSILEPDGLKGETRYLIEKIKQGEKIQRYETSRLKKDCTIMNVSVTLSPVLDTSGELVAISVISRDITDRVKAEKLLAKAENARKKEIYHRIKNNLQVISSLLDLQAEKFRDRECVDNSEVLKAFMESHDRVMSIALIHEELHEGRGNDKLNFSPYLERLVKNLFQTYRLENVNTKLNIDLEKNIFLDMDTAVPLGIIINELVSNSLKYAFLGKDKGEIQIKLCKEESRECTSKIPGSEKVGCKSTNFILTVSDNGVGMPESFNFENSDSLGLQLVTILVDQLGGELELKRHNGTEFTIRFAIVEE